MAFPERFPLLCQGDAVLNALGNFFIRFDRTAWSTFVGIAPAHPPAKTMKEK